LELHPDKTRLIEFGRYAAEQRKKRGAGKPETFNFLGFTHICGRSRPKGYFTVYRKTMGKRMAAKLKVIQRQLQGRMHEAIGDTVKWLQAVLRGYFRYHAVPGKRSDCGGFGEMCCAYGCGSYGGAVSGAVGPGNASWSDSVTSFQLLRFFIPIPACVLTPSIQGRNRVRE